jgi:hypothetical protein
MGRSYENGQAFFNYSEDFPSSTAMYSHVPCGRYEVLIDPLSDSLNSCLVKLGAERIFPVPHLTNWSEAQSIDPAQPFTLKWAAFTGATAHDYVLLMIEDSTGEYVVRTPDEFEPGVLPGTTRSITIPAGTLDYGRTYLVNVIFSKIINPGTDKQTGIRSGTAFVHTTVAYARTLDFQ